MARPRHVPVPARSQQRDPPQLDLSPGRPWASQTQGAPLESTQAPGVGSRELQAGSRAGKWLRFNFTFVSSNGPPSGKFGRGAGLVQRSPRKSGFVPSTSLILSLHENWARYAFFRKTAIKYRAHQSLTAVSGIHGIKRTENKATLRSPALEESLGLRFLTPRSSLK